MSQSQQEPERETTTSTPPRTPRWVKVFGIIALVVVVLFVISLLAGIRHGPGLHTPSGDAGGYTLAAGVLGGQG